MDLVAIAETKAWDNQRPPDPDDISDCVHCGFCLPSCPSYLVFEQEMDSPRGRIVMMKAGHEAGSHLSPTVAQHFDRCLGCMACVTACPSGVAYDRLLERTRPQIERNVRRPVSRRLLRRSVLALFTHPIRLRLLTPLLSIIGRLPLARLANFPVLRRSARLQTMIRLRPRVAVRSAVVTVPRRVGASGPSRGRVALMQGCIQRVLFNDVNAATARVLSAEGFDVDIPRRPRCCGALQSHSGLEPEAIRRAKATIAALEDHEVILVNVAGCGSAMKEYGRLLAHEPGWSDRARDFSSRVRDVSEFLAEIPPRARRHPLRLRLAYHDACHLAHAQGIRAAPRDLLQTIPGIELLEPDGWEVCCGSAGIYNILEPAAAAELGRRKADNLSATGADAIAAANPGCAMQISAHLGRLGPPVYHPLSLLDRSIRNRAAEDTS